MRAYEIILKKRNGLSLTREEINYLIEGFVQGAVPDYQVSALAMAIYFRGMTEEEAAYLTEAMVHSGETVSLEAIPGIKVDKHSSGGVGDTTTLVLAPLVASAGVPVAKFSGRGLGHTGGTLDKLESIPGFQTAMSTGEFITAVKNIGVAVAGQTESLVPADKKLYALRDVTATVDSLPLIASSIMSKKLAAGADSLILDVKCGDGAFLKEKDRALELGSMMANIGYKAGRETVAIITAMDQPLGRAVGNALEVKEAILTLRGEGPPDLTELCLVLAGWMLCLAGKVSNSGEGREILRELIASGKALRRLEELIKNQHGNAGVIEDFSLLPQAGNIVGVETAEQGYVARLGAEAIGIAAMALGAGRESKETAIDPAAGITIEKKVGDRVESGDTLVFIHAGRNITGDLLTQIRDRVLAAFEIREDNPGKPPLVLDSIDRKGR